MNEWMPNFQQRKEAWDNYNHNLGEDDGHAQAIMLLTARQIMEWGDEPCPHPIPLYLGDSKTLKSRHECNKCWAEFRKEMEG
jgi:hypothetical protein